MKIMQKTIIIALLILITGNHCVCFDSDSLREPIIRPNAETLKRWLYNQTIIIHRHSLWFNSTANIEPSKVTSLAAQGGFVFQKPPPFANYATSIWSFEYPDEKNIEQKYIATVTYSWAFTFSGINRTVNKVIITGP